MKQRVILVLGCIVGLSLGFLLASHREASVVPTVSEQTVPTVSGYVLKLHNGYIAVFDAEHPNVPIRCTDIPASSLRHYDRELLTVGIPLATEEELFLRLEDFGS